MSELKDIYLSLEISGDKDKATVAAILVANGYTVRYSTVKVGKQSRKVVQYKKERPDA